MTARKTAAKPSDEVAKAPVSDYDPVAHMLQERIDDHKAQIAGLEKQLADRG